MTEITLRDVRPGDIAAITRIYAQAVRHGTASFEIEPPDETEIARRQQTLIANGYPYLVAESAGTLAGYAYVGPYRARPAYRWTVEDSVYVGPEFHRRGLGTRLLARLIADAQAGGFRQMIAVIGDSAQLPSIRLHEAAGFALIGTMRSVGSERQRFRA